VLKDNWFIYDNIDNMSIKLADDILNLAKKSIELNNKFRIVLAGGKSFINTYKILSKSASNWSKWHIYIGDERCLQQGDKNRNDYLISKVWLNNGFIPKENINFISAELDIESAAFKYNNVLKKVLNFDLVLLGMGEDGHTASLFPNSIYKENDNILIERNSPKYPQRRISMSYSRLNKSELVFKVACGKSKQFAVELWLKGVVLPISKIQGKSEKIYICKDALSS
jgi:6-phosphogluconolactonase